MAVEVAEGGRERGRERGGETAATAVITALLIKIWTLITRKCAIIITHFRMYISVFTHKEMTAIYYLVFWLSVRTPPGCRVAAWRLGLVLKATAGQQPALFASFPLFTDDGDDEDDERDLAAADVRPHYESIVWWISPPITGEAAHVPDNHEA